MSNGERLSFRPLRVEDAEALHEAFADAELMRYWSSAPHATMAETAAYLTPAPGGKPWRGWSMALKGSDLAIGVLFSTETKPRVYEIGFLLARRWWGRGHAREAVGLLLDLLFRDEGARRVWADVDPENAPSNRLLESLGFRREGLLRGEWETHIGVRDSVIWGLLRDEWRVSS